MPGTFFDANVLLYVASSDPAKADRAEELIGAGGVIIVHVLNEITNVARRSMGMAWTETRASLSMIRGLLPVQPLTIDIHDTGLALAERYGLSIFDAMLPPQPCTPIATLSGPKISRMGSWSMAESASSTRFVNHNVLSPPRSTIHLYRIMWVVALGDLRLPSSICPDVRRSQFPALPRRGIQFQAAPPDAGFEAPLLDGKALQLMILFL